MMDAVPKFLSGVFRFTGAGLDSFAPLDGMLAYTVPFDKRSQLIYFRAGNSSPELACLLLSKNGTPFRYFPVGAKSAIHVPLAVVEDLFPESKLEVLVGAPAGASGEVVLDIGLLEI